MKKKRRRKRGCVGGGGRTSRVFRSIWRKEKVSRRVGSIKKKGKCTTPLLPICIKKHVCKSVTKAMVVFLKRVTSIEENVSRASPIDQWLNIQLLKL